MPPRVRHIVGCMTGTSLDGLDCALTRITGEGLEMSASFLGIVSRPFDDTTRAMLGRLARGEPAPPIDYMRAARTLGVLHAQTIEDLLREHPACDSPRHTHGPRAEPGADGGPIDLVVAHGQTIWHAPQDTLSWQLFDPWPIVRHLRVPVCYDLRQADLIAGGQGAPITPLADWIMYRHAADTVVNLGGIANATRLHADPARIEARDVCPCNLLLDGIVQRLFPGKRYDEGGRIAAGGQSNTQLKQKVTADVAGAIGAARTLGREQFPDGLLDAWVAAARDHDRPQNILATCVEALASLLADTLAGRNAVLAGGGARNACFVDRLRASAGPGTSLRLSDDLGIPCEAREATAFAVLGALSQDGVPITLPQVTGSENPRVAGCWVYP